MVEHARIYIAEDGDDTRYQLCRLLKESGHEIVVEASNMASALAGVEVAREAGVQLAIVDGNLTRHKLNGEEGKLLSAKLKEAIPGIRVVAFTSMTDPGYGDVLAFKGDINYSDQILQEIAAIPE